jgi:hypothetical protein
MVQKSNQAIVPQFWYVLEQLVPFDLTRKIKESKHHAPINTDNDDALPWMNPALLAEQFKLPSVKNGKVLEYNFRIYLGIFSLKSVFDFVQALPKSAQSDFEDLVSTAQNLSCYASFEVDSNGLLIDESLTCSTAPWALKRTGELLTARRQLNLDNWTEDFKKHADSRKEEFSSQAKANAEANQKVTLFELKKLLGLVCKGQWKPEEFACLGHYVIQRADRKPDDATTDILNSFYLSDLADAAIAIKTGTASKPLQQYLTATRPSQIYVEESVFLQKWLSPKYLQHGRWASDPAQNLSLMQQLAVNLAINVLKDSSGLFSVNGPPGTGKTTLLRDLIADVVVQRAEKLVSYQKPTDAFTKVEEIYRPHSSITGFEVVVTSSNNAAVENVTVELPSLDAIASQYQEKATYLRTVAESVKAVAQNQFDRQDFTHSPTSIKTLIPPNDNEEFDLSENNIPSSTWGLIAAALGNKGNCNLFCSGFWYNKENSIRVPLNEAPDDSKWNAARQRFSQCKQIVNRLISQRETYWEQVKTQASFPDKYQKAKASLLSCQQKLEAERQTYKQMIERQVQRLEQFKLHQNRLEQLQSNQPSFFSQLLDRPSYQLYQQQINASQQDFKNAERAVTQARQSVETAKGDFHKAEQNCQLAQKEVQRLEQAMSACQQLVSAKTQLGDAFGDASWWSRSHEKLQLSAPWVDQELNNARTELFLAALSVHEQFLRQSASPVRRNLARWVDLVNGDWGDLKDNHVLHLWQTLFLVVPVISTTFASIQRLFYRLPTESLGWLLIDEAGQGIPQAAVGALQRVRRAIVVGDPLQIEPVFTLDKALIKGLQGYFKVDAHWSPVEASIQTLCDRANPLGTKITTDDEPLWIGCPLWVHRRCITPMFEIANKIAYNNRMVTATRLHDDKRFPLGDSRWINIEGKCQGRHWVAAQGEEVVKLLTQAVEAEKALPNLYIISPFKSVSFELRDLLKQTKLRWAKGLTGVDEWIKRSIGTVHTFQGKEADAVILVLGADEQSRGAAAWASGKPNILNVAVTRAKYRFYIIGSKKLWAGLRYFSEASQWLRDEARPSTPRPVLRRKTQN